MCHSLLYYWGLCASQQLPRQPQPPNAAGVSYANTMTQRIRMIVRAEISSEQRQLLLLLLLHAAVPSGWWGAGP